MFKDTIKIKYRDYIRFLFVCLVIIVVALVAFEFSMYFDIFTAKTANLDDTTYLYYFLSVVIAIVLLLIAYFKLNDVKDEMRASFLMEIDRRWGDSASIKARTIIHRLYKEGEDKFDKSKCDTFASIVNYIGMRILELRDSNEKESIKEFVVLMNFLDFMETIGYLHKKGFVTKNDLNELCGCSLKFNYEIFELYIQDKRNRHSKNSFYKYFTELYIEIIK